MRVDLTETEEEEDERAATWQSRGRGGKPAAPAAAEQDEWTAKWRGPGQGGSPAAPAAADQGRSPLGEAVGRLLFASRNPGVGARRLADVINAKGCHVVAAQEARRDFLSQLDPRRWSYVIENQQFVGARRPCEVEGHGGEDRPGNARWHMATVKFNPQRVSRDRLGVLSLRLNSIHAKKPQAGYVEVGDTLDRARRLAQVDIVRGDLNMARWTRHGFDDAAPAWREGTLGELERRGYTCSVCVWL